MNINCYWCQALSSFQLHHPLCNHEGLLFYFPMKTVDTEDAHHLWDALHACRVEKPVLRQQEVAQLHKTGTHEAALIPHTHHIQVPPVWTGYQMEVPVLQERSTQMITWMSTDKKLVILRMVSYPATKMAMTKKGSDCITIIRRAVVPLF